MWLPIEVYSGFLENKLPGNDEVSIKGRHGQRGAFARSTRAEKEAPGPLARTEIGIPSVQSGQVRIKQKGNGGETEGGEEMICLGMPRGPARGLSRESSDSGPAVAGRVAAARLTRIFSSVRAYYRSP